MILDRLKRAIADNEELTLKSFVESLPLPHEYVVETLGAINEDYKTGQLSLRSEVSNLITELISENTSRLEQISIEQQIINNFFY